MKLRRAVVGHGSDNVVVFLVEGTPESSNVSRHGNSPGKSVLGPHCSRFFVVLMPAIHVYSGEQHLESPQVIRSKITGTEFRTVHQLRGNLGHPSFLARWNAPFPIVQFLKREQRRKEQRRPIQEVEELREIEVSPNRLVVPEGRIYFHATMIRP